MAATIRMATEADAPAVAAIYAPFCESTPISFEETAPPPAEMARRIRTVTERLPWLVLDEDDTVAGYTYAGPHRERAAYRWSADVTVYIGPEHRRRGVGRSLYAALFVLLRHLGYFKAFAGITLPNPASVGLHEAVGFEPVGTYRGVGHKYGVWHDVRWYQRPLQPERPDPPPPRPVSTLFGTPAWEEAVAAGLGHYR
jgi:L-amino acid N-acyltransferase YncA